MDHDTMLIPQINNRSRNWTSRVTIIEDIPTLTTRTGLKIKRYILTDDEGNEITATVFAPHIPILAPKLQLFTVHDITNAQVRFVESQYRIVDNQYQWILQRDTLIRPVQDAIPNLRHFLKNLIPISAVYGDRRPDYDIMGAVIAYEDPTTVVVEGVLKRIQRFTFVDMGEISICVTLWEEMADNQGPLLVEALNSRDVVIAKRLGFSTYNGTSLAARNNSSFTINPPIEVALDFKTWFQGRTDAQIQAMLVDQTVSRSKQQLLQGTKRIQTVAELQNMITAGHYWTRGLLQIYEENQTLYYLACSNCFSKTSAHREGVSFNCSNCDTAVTSIPRLLVIMSVSDETGMTKVAAIGSTAEKILQTTATDILNLKKLGQDYDLDSIRSDFNEKVFVMLLRRTSGKQHEGQRNMLLLGYYDDTDSAISSQIAGNSSSLQPSELMMDNLNKGKSVECNASPLSPLKRQMSEISINPESSTKKKLFLDSSGANEQDSSSSDKNNPV